MNDLPPNDPHALPFKIARLVKERGWNQEDFARISQLNRQTVHTIMNPERGTRKLRNATVSACARALGIAVNDLLTLPVERLIARLHGRVAPGADESLKLLYERTTQPELLAWLERNPERARQLTPVEVDELLGLQGNGGPMAGLGVERIVEMLERKRRLTQQVQAIAGTEYVDLLERLVGLIYEKIHPYGDRAGGAR
ncbi:MAG: helix-turn-helix transcriptional regulator [Gemmataceae bacterium]|nr:helix-turn-helix transcriptional regulator [Gemmataceae bacterium]